MERFEIQSLIFARSVALKERRFPNRRRHSQILISPDDTQNAVSDWEIAPPWNLRTITILIALVTVFLATQARGAENLSPLGVSPDWDSLERYQETITHDDFVRLLESVYCPNGASAAVIKTEAEFARIMKNKDADTHFTLRFAKSEESRAPFARSWATVQTLPPRKPSGPLSDLRVALDPGHLGGKWAQMEERWFKVGDAPAVQEGDMTLRVAQMLAPRLQQLGAKVSLVRDKLEPITPQRPGDFEELAKKILQKGGIAQPHEDFDGPADPAKEQSVRWNRDVLFYRNSEIRHRAEIVNRRLRPDVVLCLHFNAEAWGDPAKPTLVDKNHLHVLVNGCYLQPEMDFDDERFEMVRRILSRAYFEEVSLAEKLAQILVKKTQLPAYEYTKDNAIKVGTSGYVFARNLMATRLYKCPTVYLEPYVMNSQDVFSRIQAGDYEGTRKINGKAQPSIFREYSNSVVEALLEYYKARK
jgi:N-acetylmuramoyl-L-alanine amidase